MKNPTCDWCGRPAVSGTYRTLYENTEIETTSYYFECEHCCSLDTNSLVGRYKIIHLPHGFKQFVVESEWLNSWRSKNMKGGDRDLHPSELRFITEFAPIIYEAAVKEGKVISEC